MTDVSCARWAERLGDYVDGLLSDDDRIALEDHIGSCAACSGLLRDYRAVPELLRRATDVTMPSEAQARLLRLLKLVGRGPK